ncbi:MAG: PD-(D/E)XK nuclease family protein [Pseudomonadota bacterium]
MTTYPLDAIAATPTTQVLCATTRLADELRQRHGQLQAAQGQRSWQALACCTLGQWLQALRLQWLLRGTPPTPELARTPLSAWQERELWQRLIAQRLGPEAPYLFDLPALAQSAQQALALQLVWEVEVGAPPLAAEAQQYLRWRGDFLAECAAQGWATTEQLDRTTVDALAELAQPPAGPGWPQRLLLAGFPRLSPLLQALLHQLQRLGVQVQHLADEPAAEHLEVRRYPDAAAECLAAAQWAQAQLALDAQRRIAIVAPDLRALRLQLHDTLQNLLAPEQLHPQRAQAAPPFNLSLGAPLAEQALVGGALALLHCLARPDELSLNDVGALLRHPYWSAADEALVLAQLDARLRSALPARVALGQVLAWAMAQRERWQGAEPAQCLQHLQQLQQLAARAVGQSHPPSHWATLLPGWLEQAGWLHRRSLSSPEFQALQAWQEVLAELGRLDACCGPLRLGGCVQRLQALCRERIFQPQSVGQPRLQVLGALEASGLRFDAVWVLGLHAAAWPPPPQPNPLLPYAAQRRAASPNASAAVQYAFAQQVQQRLLRAAPALWFSWPRSAEAAPCQPSPLLADLPSASAFDAAPNPHWSAQALRSGQALAARTTLDDAWAPPMSAEEAARGGSALLRAQALCPAWAYYQYRLAALGLLDAAEDLDARQRGNLMHAALARLWQTLRDSATLHGLSAAACQAAIEQACCAALEAHLADPDQPPLSTRRRALEQRRLERLLQRWLELERTRGSGFAVVGIEQNQFVELCGLQLKLQIDRIDQLDDGRLLVIDYKSSPSIDTRNWASQRLSEPQLPLYATCAALPSGQVAGALFAKVRPTDPGWAGLVADDAAHPNPSAQSALRWDSSRNRTRYPLTRFPCWEAVLQHWRERLQALAAELRAGDAAVRLADPAQLRHCEVLPLLRLSERRSQWLALQAESAATVAAPAGAPVA